MSVLEIILVFYILPFLINGITHYLDEDVKTLGDWFSCFVLIAVPIVNLFSTICFLIYILAEKLKIGMYWKKLMSIKIKSLIIIFSSFLFFSCANVEQRIREHSYTEKFYYIDSLRFQVYKTKSGREYIIILNERETKFIRKYI